MLAVKQEALKTIDELPDDTDIDEIMYRLYVLDKVRKGQEAVEQGRILRVKNSSRKLIHGNMV